MYIVPIRVTSNNSGIALFNTASVNTGMYFSNKYFWYNFSFKFYTTGILDF